MTDVNTSAADTVVDKVADTSTTDAATSDTSNDTAVDTGKDSKITTKDTANVADTTAEHWSSDWREKYAGKDEKRLNQLKRYASPKAALDAMFAAQQKLSSGQFKEALAKDATPEQVAEWRKGNGIPETHDKYDTTLPDGMVIGEMDKPIVDQFLKEMHGKNATPDQVKAALTAYYKVQGDMVTQMKDDDQNFRNGSEDTLRSEWGNDYQRNMNAVINLRDSMPDELQDRIFGGRTADGKMLGDDPAFLNWFHSISTDVNPIGAITPAGSSGGMDGIMAEKASLEKKMGTKSYGQAERNRMTEINETLEKIEKRGKAA